MPTVLQTVVGNALTSLNTSWHAALDTYSTQNRIRWLDGPTLAGAVPPFVDLLDLRSELDERDVDLVVLRSRASPTLHHSLI